MFRRKFLEAALGALSFALPEIARPKALDFDPSPQEEEAIVGVNVRLIFDPMIPNGSIMTCAGGTLYIPAEEVEALCRRGTFRISGIDEGAGEVTIEGA